MLDFDQLLEMTPDELLAYREQAIEDYINSLPDDRQQRLRQLQWTIDGELRKYKDPIAKMNKMVELFWDGVKEFHSTINQLSNITPRR